MRIESSTTGYLFVVPFATFRAETHARADGGGRPEKKSARTLFTDQTKKKKKKSAEGGEEKDRTPTHQGKARQGGPGRLGLRYFLLRPPPSSFLPGVPNGSAKTVLCALTYSRRSLVIQPPSLHITAINPFPLHTIVPLSYHVRWW